MFVNKKKIIGKYEEEGPEDEGEDVKCVFPMLYNLNKLGAKIYWRAYVCGDTLFRFAGQVGGKNKSLGELVCTGKSIGRKNETTPHQQALFIAQTKFEKKKESGYYEEDDKGNKKDSEIKQFRPMLAKKYLDRKKVNKITFPLCASPKLDGIRGCVVCDPSKDESGVEIYSRLGKKFTFLLKIKEHLTNLYSELDTLHTFDGEVYSHDIPFNVLSGCVRSQKTLDDIDSEMEYHIFNIPSSGLEYTQEMELLKEIEGKYNTLYDEKERVLKFVYYTLINSDAEIDAQHDAFVNQGYEGVMLRAPNSYYEFNSRSSSLLKYKKFVDEEFEVIGFEKSKGTEEGCVVFVCRDNNSSKTFSVRPRGSVKKRQYQYDNGENYIGKKLTVRYQPQSCTHDEDIVPRFPVGIKFDLETSKFEAVAIRDYE